VVAISCAIGFISLFFLFVGGFPVCAAPDWRRHCNY